MSAKWQLLPYALQQNSSLFDHLVGAAEHGRRHCDSQRSPALRGREFIGLVGSAAAALPFVARAQQLARPASGDATAIKPAQAIADYIVNFDLKNVPSIVIERARVAWIDTVGVMLAGTRPPTSSAT